MSESELLIQSQSQFDRVNRNESGSVEENLGKKVSEKERERGRE